MIALPVQGRCAFASLHPAVTFAFFTGALLLCMVFAHPLLQVEAVCLAALCYVSFRGRGAWPFIGGLAVLLAVVAFASPLFNTQGETVLFRWWAGRPYTLEALALGASTGLMLAAMMLWFASYHLVMTSDKFTFLFGRALPGLSTVLVMVLRLVPASARGLPRVPRWGLGCARRERCFRRFPLMRWKVPSLLPIPWLRGAMGCPAAPTTRSFVGGGATALFLRR